MFESGDVVDGKYRVDRQIGKGGMGVVYEATHLTLGNRVALKFLSAKVAALPQVVDRFVREGRAAARLRNEHVCQVLDIGTHRNRPYLVMELLDGIDLGELIGDGRLDVEVAVDLIRQACKGLAAAHARDIVHRDLKPDNLFLARRDDGSMLVKLVDFGVAKAPDQQQLTGSVQMIGSPAYMSPEQILSSRDVDKRSDVWSLGVILYRLVSGRLPFPATTVAAVAFQIVEDEVPPLTDVRLPAGLAAVIGRCLDKDPDRRYASVDELSSALRPFGKTASDPTLVTKDLPVVHGTGPKSRVDAADSVTAVTSVEGSATDVELSAQHSFEITQPRRTPPRAAQVPDTLVGVAPAPSAAHVPTPAAARGSVPVLEHPAAGRLPKARLALAAAAAFVTAGIIVLAASRSSSRDAPSAVAAPAATPNAPVIPRAADVVPPSPALPVAGPERQAAKTTSTEPRATEPIAPTMTATAPASAPADDDAPAVRAAKTVKRPPRPALRTSPVRPAGPSPSRPIVTTPTAPRAPAEDDIGKSRI